MTSSFSGPRAWASAAASSAWSLRFATSASLSWASASFVRASISAFRLASSARACASRSLASCSVETMRITPPLSIFCRPLTSRIVSSACSQVTLRRETESLPLTSSPATIFRPLSALRMRRRLMTSASLNSSVISLDPFGWAGGARSRRGCRLNHEDLAQRAAAHGLGSASADGGIRYRNRRHPGLRRGSRRFVRLECARGLRRIGRLLRLGHSAEGPPGQRRVASPARRFRLSPARRGRR